MAKRSCEFKTEVSQLLNLMIHSLYSNRDIFLRELIANAADAIDKARFDSLTDPAQARDWKISIGIDKEAKILTITDNGIGMTEQEVIDNVGTIAKSGTRAFLKMLEEKGTSAADMPEMIGQFGVGFYSAFMVASKVELRTKRSGSDAPAVCWSSTGEGSFEIESCDRTEPGTEIKMFLKDDAEMYLESWKLTGIIHKYSDYIEYPITVPEVKVDEDKKETVTEKTVNSQKAIWLRKPSEITEDEYKSFYTHISNFAGTNYLKPIHISAEGVSEFKALLFLPKEAPFNLLMPDIQKKGLQLYVKRVFITDECKALLPDYLRFVSGVVDSGDLPLNVSREILQDNPHIAKIEKTITSKILGELKKLIENDRENYDLFFTEFGKILKEGLHTDFTNAEKLKDLVLYGSMNTPEDKKITLAEYVSAMPENQPAIYYITGDKRESVESNPGLEYFRKQGYDVLFMTDPIDEWVMQSMNQYAKKNFVSITKDGLEIDGAEETVKAAAEKYGKILEYLKKEFEGKVSEVRFSVRLTESPCCLITEGSALAPHMERLFRAMNQAVPESKRILELNPEHPLIAALNDMAGDAENPDLKKYANVLWDQALLSEGSPIKDTAAFVKNVTELMLKGIGK
ncbi:MAG: molecular chaperone HtpG [Lentisphaerae bacterium]|nr:molecular chaperone HtpG [Lentisphaerota bacterium]